MSDYTIQQFFTQTNILVALGFLAVFTVLGVVSGNNAIVDIIVLSAIGLFIAYIIFDNKNAKTDVIAEVRRELSDFNTIYYVGLAIALMYLYMFISSKMVDGYPFTLGLLIGISWIYMAILLIVNFTTSVFNIPLVDFIFDDVFKPLHKKKIDDSNEPKTPVVTDEVFNISNNLYTYEDASNICSAYNSRLATYDDIEKAYVDGAEWCNYGWSEGQMAFFPTQKATWTELQKSPRHKNNCGRPGINGGYMANPYIKFGVNCFGKKPKATTSDLSRLSGLSQIAPLTPADLITSDKIKYWKNNADKLLVINSYNRKKWSEY